MNNYVADEDYATSTNAYLRDSDGDHAPDGTFFIPFAGSYRKYMGEDRNNNGKNTEVIESIPETDPNDPISWPPDSFDNLDFDSLEDIIELEIGTDPEMRDTDNDGLSDGEEYYGAYYGTIYSEIHDQNEPRFKTDPLNPDTDYDGLPDGLELGRIIGIPYYISFPGTYTSLGITYQNSGYDYDSSSYQTALNALASEEKSQYTIEFKDKDGVTRFYPRFIPDSDSNDIKTRTNSLKEDTNYDMILDGWHDKNKNGKYIINYYSSQWEKENDESDAVFGIVPLYGERNTFNENILYFYSPLDSLGMELNEEIVPCNGNINGETICYFNFGSSQYNTIDIQINGPGIVKHEDSIVYDILGLNSAIISLRSVTNFNVTGSLIFNLYNNKNTKYKSSNNDFYECIYKNNIAFRPTKKKMKDIQYNLNSYARNGGAFGYRFRNKFNVFNIEKEGSILLRLEPQIENKAYSIGNVLITLAIQNMVNDYWETCYYAHRIADRLRLSGYNVDEIGTSLVSGVTYTKQSEFIQNIILLLNSKEYLLWLDVEHGIGENDLDDVKDSNYRYYPFLGTADYGSFMNELRNLQNTNNSLRIWNPKVETIITDQCNGGSNELSQSIYRWMNELNAPIYIGAKDNYDVYGWTGTYFSSMDIQYWVILLEGQQLFRHIYKSFGVLK
jgi:hypothetical protein